MKYCTNTKKLLRTASNKRLLLIAIIFVTSIYQPPSHAVISLEHKVKAAYIFKMLKFIEWKNDSQDSSSANNLNICVVGSGPIVEAIGLLDSKKAKGQPISVNNKSAADNLESCQIVFVARSEHNNIKSILSKTSPKTNLTISDIDGFARSGGMVELALIENKVKLVINLIKTNNSLIQFSSKLLNIAILIDKNGN